MPIMVERNKWILYKHTSNYELIKAVALDVKNSCKTDISNIERERMQERLAALNLYKTRNPKAKPLDSINHRINTLEYFMFGYENNTDGKKFMFSPLGNLFLKHISDKDKLTKIFTTMLFAIQFQHPASGTDKEFQLYPFRLIFKLLIDERLDYRLYNYEYALIIAFVDSIDDSKYEDLVNLERMGDKSAKNLLEAIEKSKEKEQLYVLEENEIVHCDIKKTNIMWNDAKNCPVLIDFAGAIHHGADDKSTMVYATTAWNFPPEATTGQTANKFTDFYMLGLALREIVVGGRELEDKYYVSSKTIPTGLPNSFYFLFEGLLFSDRNGELYKSYRFDSTRLGEWIKKAENDWYAKENLSTYIQNGTFISLGENSAVRNTAERKSLLGIEYPLSIEKNNRPTQYFSDSDIAMDMYRDTEWGYNLIMNDVEFYFPDSPIMKKKSAELKALEPAAKGQKNDRMDAVYVKFVLNNLENKKQSILLINRRGYNTFAACDSCGSVINCPSCSISLTYHAANNRLMCHYCGYSKPFTSVCSECGKSDVRYAGYGTQKIEQEIAELLPEARVLRMDTDSISSRFSFEKGLSDFGDGSYDILLGTQMVAKGLNFENVTLVGVINADQQLNNDDFRSEERTFDLLTQVVGRSGRGAFKGVAVIQTLTPENHIIQFAQRQDFESFYNSEIVIRKALVYPPYCDLCVMTFSSEKEVSALNCSREFLSELENKLKYTISLFKITHEIKNPIDETNVPPLNRMKVIL